MVLNGLQIDPSVRPQVRNLVSELGKLSGGAITSSDLAIEGNNLVAKSPRGQVFLDELSRSGGTSAGWDPADGKVDAGSVIRIQQHANKHSLANAMLDARFIDLFRGVDAQRSLLDNIKAQEDEQKERKDAAEARAHRELEGTALPDDKWARSYFTKDEMGDAVEARFRELWTRKDARQLRALDAQGDLLKKIIKKEEAGATTPEAKEELRSLKVDFIEIAVAASLNEEGGNLQNAMSYVKHWLRKMNLLSRENQNTAAPALDVALPGNASSEPVDSRLLSPRSPEEVTPQKLRDWPFAEVEVPKVGEGEVVKLMGFRDRSARGTHPSVVCKNARGEELQVKFFTREVRGVSTPAINARILYALGRGTEGSNAVASLRMEARAVLAAFENMNRLFPGIPYPDDHIPGVGGPTKKLGKGLHHMNENVIASVKVKGQAEPLTGAAAVAKLNEAKGYLKQGNRAPLDAIEWVEVKNVDVEYNSPTSSIGGLAIDRIGHRDRRDIRSLGTGVQSWLHIWDIKDDNFRVDIRKTEDGPQVLHVLSDVDGSSGADLPWKVGVFPNDLQLHNDIVRHDVKAFDLQTKQDALWDLADIVKLTEDQLRGCVAGGTFDSRAGWEHFEKLLSRRDDYVKEFGLKVPLFRPDGPKAYSPDWDRL